MEDTKKDNVIPLDLSEGDISAFLRDMAHLVKRYGIKSALVVTIDDSNHASWQDFIHNEHHAAVMALVLEDAREDIKSLVFGIQEE